MLAEVSLFNPRRKRRKSRKAAKARRRNPRKRRHTARRKVRTVVVARRRVSRRARSVKRRYRARSRNPRFSLGGVTAALVPAAVGGAGAVALDVALGYGQNFLPAALTSGYGRVAVKLGGAFALGWAASKLIGRERGKAVALGALTVVAYDLFKTIAKQVAPAVPGLAGDYTDNVGAFLPDGVGGYNPAPYVREDAPIGAFLDDV